MKKIYLIFIITTILSCNSSKNSSIESLIEDGNIEELKKRKKEYVDTMNNLQVELNSINNGIAFLDENEKLTLVTKFDVEENLFSSFIETQANLKTRKNIIILPEFQGTLERLLVDEGQKVKKGQLLAQINDSGLQDQLDQMMIQNEFAKENFERTQRLWDNQIGSEMQYLKSKTDTGGYRLEVEVPGSGARFGSIGTENYQFIIANTDDSGIKKLQQFRKNSNSFSNMPNENKPGDGDLDWLGAKSSYYPALSKTKSGTEDYLEGYLQNLFNEVNNQNVKITGNKNKFILNKTIASEIAVAINSIKSKINKEITLENLYNLSASQGFRTGISKQQLQARGEKVIASKVTANNIFDSCFYIKVY